MDNASHLTALFWLQHILMVHTRLVLHHLVSYQGVLKVINISILGHQGYLPGWCGGHASQQPLSQPIL